MLSEKSGGKDHAKTAESGQLKEGLEGFNAKNNK